MDLAEGLETGLAISLPSPTGSSALFWGLEACGFFPHRVKARCCSYLPLRRSMLLTLIEKRLRTRHLNLLHIIRLQFRLCFSLHSSAHGWGYMRFMCGLFGSGARTVSCWLGLWRSFIKCPEIYKCALSAMFSSAPAGVSSRGKKVLCNIESSGSDLVLPGQCMHYGSATK